MARGERRRGSRARSRDRSLAVLVVPKFTFRAPSWRPSTKLLTPSSLRTATWTTRPHQAYRFRPKKADGARIILHLTSCAWNSCRSFGVLPLTLLAPPAALFSIILCYSRRSFSCAVCPSFCFFHSSTAAPRSCIASLLLFVRAESSGYQSGQVNRDPSSVERTDGIDGGVMLL